MFCRFIPVLARESVGILEDQRPYIIGMNSYILDALEPPEGVVIAHLDRNWVKYSPGAFINFPMRFRLRLRHPMVKFVSTSFVQSMASVARACVLRCGRAGAAHDTGRRRRRMITDDMRAGSEDQLHEHDGADAKGSMPDIAAPASPASPTALGPEMIKISVTNADQVRILPVACCAAEAQLMTARAGGRHRRAARTVRRRRTLPVPARARLTRCAPRTAPVLFGSCATGCSR